MLRLTSLLLLLPSLLLALPSPNNVYVLVNKNSISSILIGTHYAAKRNIPRENLIEVVTTTDESISWKNFVSTIYNPLQKALIQKGAITAQDLHSSDPLNRNRYLIENHTIDFLVLTHGIPLKIQEYFSTDPFNASPPPSKLEQTQASVDSELSVLPQLDSPISGFIPNPLYNKQNPSESDYNSIIRVSRLDGPSRDAINNLVTNAIAAETHGLQGRAYIDPLGPNKLGNQWLFSIANKLTKKAFDVVVNPHNDTFPFIQRFDAPALYFGWQSPQISGPFLRPGFKFPPGAIAVHLHPTSAYTLRDPNQYWVGPLVEKGVTATLGSITEPYLQYSHNLEFFTDALYKGKSLGEASYFANPALSWQTITIGDPLYTPFSLSLKKQLEDIDNNPSPYAQYAVIRQMNFLKRHRTIDKAIAFGRRYNDRHSGLALQFHIAKFMAEKSDYSSAHEALAFVNYIESYNQEVYLLCEEIAEFLSKSGNPELSLTIYESLIEYTPTDLKTLKYTLRKGIDVALAAENHQVHEDWIEKFDSLSLPQKTTRN